MILGISINTLFFKSRLKYCEYFFLVWIFFRVYKKRHQRGETLNNNKIIKLFNLYRIKMLS